MLRTTEVVVLDRTAGRDGDEQSLIGRGEHTAGCGTSPEEGGRVPLRAEEAATKLPVVPEQVQVRGERLVLATEPVDAEAEVVEPGRALGCRDRVHRRAGLAGNVQGEHR